MHHKALLRLSRLVPLLPGKLRPKKAGVRLKTNIYLLVLRVKEHRSVGLRYPFMSVAQLPVPSSTLLLAPPLGPGQWPASFYSLRSHQRLNCHLLLAKGWKGISHWDVCPEPH